MENIEIVFIQTENGRSRRSLKSYIFSNSKKYKLKVGDIIKDVNYKEEMIVIGFTAYAPKDVKDLNLKFINGVRQEELPSWGFIINKVKLIDHSLLAFASNVELMNYSNLLILARYFNGAWKRSEREICYSITRDDRVIKVLEPTTVGSIYFHDYKDAVKALEIYKKIRM